MRTQTALRLLISKAAAIEEACSPPQPSQIQVAERSSTDPFVAQEVLIAQRVRLTEQHLQLRDEVIRGKHGRGSVEAVKAKATVRKDLKELQQLQQTLVDLHNSVDNQNRGRPSKVKLAAAERVASLAAVEHTIEALRTQERSNATTGRAASDASRRHQAGLQSNNTSWPRRSQGGCDGDGGLQVALQQIERNDQALESELGAVYDGVQRLAAVTMDMNTELKLQGAMLADVGWQADGVNEHLERVNCRVVRMQ